MRIGIANDSPTATEAMSRVLTGTHQVAWVARNGREAVQRCAEDRPDLVLMDLIMPELDGVEATRQIMARTPCAILVVTAAIDERVGKVFEAIGAGALDAVNTPTISHEVSSSGAAALLSKIDLVRRLVGNANERPSQPAARRTSAGCSDHLVVFGASAGGPAALAAIFSGLPANFPAAMVIVQHVDQEFAALMAKWLTDESGFPVRIARQGDRPQPGTAMMASTSDHLVLSNDCSLGYTRDPQSCSYRPSVDVFFESVVRCWKGDVTGVLLTGMGRDGARGLKALRDRGALTIAQAQESCVVYGMPKAAANIGAAAEILPVGDIARRLRTRCATHEHP